MRPRRALHSVNIVVSVRILQITPTYLPATRYGGPIYSVHGLSKALSLRGHEVQVYTTNVDGTGVSPVPLGVPADLDGVDVTYFPTALGRRLYRSPSMAQALQRNLSAFDLVHLHSVFLWPTAVGAAMARRHRVPYVLSPRGMLVPELIYRKSRLLKRAWIRLIERRNLMAAASVHMTTDVEAADLLRLGLAASRMDVIPNGIDLPAEVNPTVDQKQVRPKPEATVLCLGRINWKKGLERLIPAMRYVPHANLSIVGNDEDNYTRHLLEIAARAGVANRTHFLGPVHGEQKWQTYAGADVFALSSYSENFGIVVLEAMACGVPVVVTPEVGLANAVITTGAGLVVDGDPETFGRAIAKLLADPEMRRRMGEAGRAAARERFSWAAVAEQMEGLYLELAHGAKSETRGGEVG
jgi:glycosyltransferase involved in cell wall biosynthesis